MATRALQQELLQYYLLPKDQESPTHWQQNDYKVLNPSVTENPDFSKVPTIQNMPVTSVVCEPEKGSKVKVDTDGTISVKGSQLESFPLKRQKIIIALF